MTKAAAKTGMGPTVLVAVEQCFPEDQRIIEDSLAYRILLPGMGAFVWLARLSLFRDWMVRETEKEAPGLWGGMTCRKRYIDEKLTDSVNRIEAVVNLGAGFDTRVYRLPSLSSTSAWEVDQPENIKSKKSRLHKLFGAVAFHVRLVTINFDQEELGTFLASHGYSADRRTFLSVRRLHST